MSRAEEAFLELGFVKSEDRKYKEIYYIRKLIDPFECDNLPIKIIFDTKFHCYSLIFAKENGGNKMIYAGLHHAINLQIKELECRYD